MGPASGAMIPRALDRAVEGSWLGPLVAGLAGERGDGVAVVPERVIAPHLRRGYGVHGPSGADDQHVAAIEPGRVAASPRRPLFGPSVVAAGGERHAGVDIGHPRQEPEGRRNPV